MDDKVGLPAWNKLYNSELKKEKDEKKGQTT